ncbi:MFS transporter [Planomicrobium chinense]|uniref:MFS transporter n=1 Tax=Planococcus chinensis TaxID=272917 RepID=UPI001CC72F3D|nr:MFS transporter [Planococcus chinensis]MBZ5199713.1 MFS transporter [Planococcus chinensis]
MISSNPRLWTKDFILTSSVNFFLVLIFYLLMVTIAVYAGDTYGASTSEAGLVTGIFIIGVLAGRLMIGRFLDRIGRKRTMVIGLALFTLTTFFYFLELGLPFLMFNRFLHGMMLGFAATAAGTIVAQIIPASRKGEGIGYFSLSNTLATAIGPFIGLYMNQHSSYEMLFALCLACGAASLAISFFVTVPPIDALPAKDEIKGFKLSHFVEPKAVPITLVIFIVAFCYAGVLSFINFYAVERGLVEAASFFFIVYSIAVLFSRPFTGRLMDAKGANYVMYPAFFIFAVGLLLLSTAETTLPFLLSGFLIGLGFGNMQSTSQAVAIKLTPPHRMGLATSTFFIFMDAGLGFGPYLLGFIIVMTGYSTMYAILGGVVAAVSILYYFLHGKKEHQANRLASA